jgi:outer membrane usher protein
VTGRAAVIAARLPNGAALPFGATVYDAKGQSVGAIGQNSRIFVRGVADEGALTVKWGDAADEQCAFGYHLPPKGEDRGAYAHIDAVCGAIAGVANQAAAGSSAGGNAQ